MSEEIIRMCGIALVCAASAYLLKRLKSELSFGITLLASLIFFGAVLSSMSAVIDEISEILNASGSYEYFLPIVKCLGIALAVQITSGVCADCGESRIADGIELVGKFEMLLISLPLIKSIIGYAIDLISLE